MTYGELILKLLEDLNEDQLDDLVVVQHRRGFDHVVDVVFYTDNDMITRAELVTE